MYIDTAFRYKIISRYKVSKYCSALKILYCEHLLSNAKREYIFSWISIVLLASIFILLLSIDLLHAAVCSCYRTSVKIQVELCLPIASYTVIGGGGLPKGITRKQHSFVIRGNLCIKVRL